ncbi:MAG: DUF5060 domain-containing protein, partial [Bacteroidetes bacterium]|nr:DUF5060 domain-containing protein [Bacteroidota bacterium]
MKTPFLPFFLLILGLVLASEGICQKSAPIAPLRAPVYGVLDIPFKVKTPVSNPFDLPFGGVFTDESGATLTVPGFYNGGNEYILRFSPTRKGR